MLHREFVKDVLLEDDKVQSEGRSGIVGAEPLQMVDQRVRLDVVPQGHRHLEPAPRAIDSSDGVDRGEIAIGGLEIAVGI
mgnify:CR=1 FL=1